MVYAHRDTKKNFGLMGSSFLINHEWSCFVTEVLFRAVGGSRAPEEPDVIPGVNGRYSKFLRYNLDSAV